MQAEECELVVVGAGLAALHLVSRLPSSLQQGTVVVDSSGVWLAGWDARCEALAAPHLRTPVTQHPHASPGALQAFAEKRGRREELVPVVKGFAPVPTTSLFRDFCRTKVVGALPAALRMPRRDTVLRTEPLLHDAGGGSPGGTHAGCRVHLASGKALVARAAVYTPANRRPVLPAWARPLATAPAPATPARTPTAETEAPGSGCSAVSGWQLPAGVATSDCVDLRTADLAGKRVLVVGGGMSAGLLAAGAAERGAEVTLVCRRPLKPQPFETEVGWWGNKHLNDFRQLESAVLRHRTCQRARRQGSVHLPLWRRLTEQAAAGRLTVLEGWEVEAAEQQNVGSSNSSDSSSNTAAWLLSLRRRQPAVPLSRRQQREEAAPTTFQQAVAATTSAAAGVLDGDASAAQPEQPEGETQPEPQQAEPPSCRQLAADHIWLACGAAYNATTDPVLAQLLQQRPTPLTGGYPWLDDEHLCWPGAAVYVLGRGSMLSVGPCAGDLPGIRLAADRVARSLQRLDYAEAPVWEAARERLRHRLLAAGFGTPGSSAVIASCGGQAAADVAECLAAAVAAAQRSAEASGAGWVPLEAEGVMYEDPKPRAPVSKPDHLIDISDLDAALPRREVQRYKFTDDDFEICVICQLDEPVPLDQVRVLFGAQHLEMWAVGRQAAYHLHLPRLYGRVVAKKCKTKVNQKACKVLLLLHKESDTEWRFLKG